MYVHSHIHVKTLCRKLSSYRNKSLAYLVEITAALFHPAKAPKHQTHNPSATASALESLRQAIRHFDFSFCKLATSYVAKI